MLIYDIIVAAYDYQGGEYKLSTICHTSAHLLIHLVNSIYFSLILTTKEYMHNITAVEPKVCQRSPSSRKRSLIICFTQWLTQVAPSLFKVADQSRLSKMKREERIQPLYNKYVRLARTSSKPGSTLKSTHRRKNPTSGVSPRSRGQQEVPRHSVKLQFVHVWCIILWA